MVCLFTLIELCAIGILSKYIKVSGNICCFSHPFIVRAVHCYALCNMLWFAHRVANCFFVSIYFVAIAPSQTIAVISLLVSVITIVIVGLTLVIYHMLYSTNTTFTDSDNAQTATTIKCLKICNILTILLMIICVIATLVFFTIIFVDLTQHGLSATHIGSILISMAIPTLILGLSIAIKRYFKSKEESDKGDGNISRTRSGGYQSIDNIAT